jgi:hypothetical protein
VRRERRLRRPDDHEWSAYLHPLLGFGPRPREGRNMKIGIRLSWLSLRALIEWTALKLWWKGMDYGEARERAATAALLFLHREAAPQFGTPRVPGKESTK